MKEFRDKTAVITGAASGIGRAIAERSAREGMKVVLADIEEKALAEAENEMKAGGAKVLAVPTDVSKAGEVEALAQKTLAKFGAAHLVCNNAGVGVAPKPLWETELSDWEWCLGVNLWGVIHGIRTFVPVMLRQNTEGHIVNVASVAGLLSLPYVAIYHASKHAVVTITESLHYELALQNAKLRTSVLCPGWVGTRIMDCYRNRPAALGETKWQGPAVVASMWEAYRQACEAGFPAEYVAEQVFHAIWHESLYILTTTDFNELVTQRAGNIVAQRSPVLDAKLVEALGLTHQAVGAVAHAASPGRVEN